MSYLERNPVNVFLFTALYSTFLTSGHSKCITILPNIHPFMHTFKHPTAVTLIQGHIQLAGSSLVQLGGAGIEPAPFRLPANPLYLLSHMPPEDLCDALWCITWTWACRVSSGMLCWVTSSSWRTLCSTRSLDTMASCRLPWRFWISLFLLFISVSTESSWFCSSGEPWRQTDRQRAHFVVTLDLVEDAC